jgi:hypothetical protein
MLDLLELCLYFNDDSEVENDLEDDPQQMPGFIKRSSIKIDGPAQISSSFLVVVFGSMVQAFDDLRKIKSNRTKAANALFMAAADHLVTHAISQLKGGYDFKYNITYNNIPNIWIPKSDISAPNEIE